MEKIKKWMLNKELRYILLPISALIPIVLIIVFIVIKYFKDRYLSSISLGWIPGTFITAILISPSAYLLWLWRDQNKLKDQEHVEKQLEIDKNNKEWVEIKDAMRLITGNERVFVKIAAVGLLQKYLLSDNKLMQMISFDFLKNIINGIIKGLNANQKISDQQILICKACIRVVDLAIEQDMGINEDINEKNAYIHVKRDTILKFPEEINTDLDVGIKEMFNKQIER